MLRGIRICMICLQFVKNLMESDPHKTFQGGPGKPGTDGVPSPTVSYVPSFTPTGTPTYFECYRDDKGEDCCARGINLKYCSGEFPLFGCYVDGLQKCCDNGEICYGEKCCEALWVCYELFSFLNPFTKLVWC